MIISILIGLWLMLDFVVVKVHRGSVRGGGLFTLSSSTSSYLCILYGYIRELPSLPFPPAEAVSVGTGRRAKGNREDSLYNR